MGWRVKTLDKENFALACAELEYQVQADRYPPDIILAVLEGGKYVADNVFRELPHYETRLQRTGTAAKKGWKRELVRRLPRFFQDRLRIIEASMLSRRHDSRGSADVSLPFGAEMDGRRILIVDDAVDSGRTLRLVCEAVSRICPSSDIRSAVITVTTDSPETDPDYALYRDRTLVRFPWSMDS